MSDSVRPHRWQPTRLPRPWILQARTLEWFAISFSNAWKWKVKVKSLSRVRLLETPWTTAYQALPSMDFPGKSTGVGCHCLLRQHLYCAPKSILLPLALCLSPTISASSPGRCEVRIIPEGSRGKPWPQSDILLLVLWGRTQQATSSSLRELPQPLWHPRPCEGCWAELIS